MASYAGCYGGIPDELFIPAAWNISLSPDSGLPFRCYCKEKRSDILEKLHKYFTEIAPLGNYVHAMVTAVAMALLLFRVKEFENMGWK